MAQNPERIFTQGDPVQSKARRFPDGEEVPFPLKARGKVAWRKIRRACLPRGTPYNSKPADFQTAVGAVLVDSAMRFPRSRGLTPGDILPWLERNLGAGPPLPVGGPPDAVPSPP